MATFFLHIRSATQTVIDSIGSEHLDLQSAREEAEKLVREFLSEKLWFAAAADHNDIEICDPSGQRLELVTLKRVLAMALPLRTTKVVLPTQ